MAGRGTTTITTIMTGMRARHCCITLQWMGLVVTAASLQVVVGASRARRLVQLYWTACP
jgi:hypothetical protein